MRNDTIYLLYNADTSDIKVHAGPPAERSRKWSEYEDKDEFVILYGPGDERKYTDIKVVSKTRLRERPKSTGALAAAPRGQVEGILLRRTSSLRELLKRVPMIRPLLSEQEIARLQRIQEECKLHRYVDSFKKSASGVEGPWSPFADAAARLHDDVKGQRPGGEDIMQSIPPLDLNLMPKRKLSPLQIGQAHMGNIGGQISPDRILKKEKREVADRGKKYPEKPDTIDKLQKQPKGKGSDIKQKEPTSANKSKPKTKKETMASLVKQRKEIDVDTTKKKKKKSVMEKDDVYSSVKSKLIKQRQSPTSKKNYEEEKTKKDKDTPKKSEILTKSKKEKTNRSSKSELSSKSEKSAKDVKRKDDHESKQENKGKDAKSIKSELNSKTEHLSRVDNTLKSTINIKRKQSVSPSSITKGSDNTAKGSSGKKNKGARGDTADDKITSAKQKRAAGDKGGDLESIRAPKSKNVLGHGSYIGGKSTDVVTPKDKRGRTKSIVTMAGSSPAGKSADSGHLATSSMKGKEEKPHKKSRASSNVLDYMFKYVLSDPVYIKLGWTLSANDRILNRVVTFKTTPANPDLYYFKERREALFKSYASGNVAVNIQTDGSGEIRYPSGHPAIVIKSTPSGMRLTIFSDKKKEPSVEHSNKAKLLGMFDSFGNGVVYNKSGRKLLKYNQLEGIYNNPSSNAQYKWRWNSYHVLASQRVKELMNYMAKEHQSPQPVKGKRPATGASSKPTVAKGSVDREYDRILEELPCPAPHKSTTKRFPSSSGFKSTILKITDEITLRITGQENITITFSADKVKHRMDLGVKVDPEAVERIEDVSLENIEDIPCVFEALRNMSPSLEKLNRELNPEKKTSIKKRRTSNIL